MMPRAPGRIWWALATALLLGGMLLSVLAPPAMAEGVNLNWSDCIAGGLCSNKDSACNANTGASTLVGSCVSPAHIDSMCANEIVIDLQSDGATLPLWWNFQTGGCRAGSLTRSFDFTGGPFSCADHWAGNVTINALGYTPGYSGPNTARIVMVASVPSADCSGPGGTGIDPGIEYYSFKLTVNHARTVGADSCAGCLDAACIVLSEIKLQSPARGTTPVQINLMYEDVQRWVSWHSGFPTTKGCSFGQSGATCPDDDTPVLNRTWGQIKSIYR